MRKVIKNAEPVWFQKWKDDFRNNNGRTPIYGDLDNEKRRILRQELIAEQGEICCYCMRRIGINNSHNEHFRPRSKFHDLELDYGNIFASCQGQDDVVIENWHCDQKKEDWFDDRIPSLLSDEIERCIKYTISGKAEPFHSQNSPKYEIEKKMIDNLGLNAPFLIRNRKMAIENSEIMDLCDYSDDDWKSFVEYYDSKHDGKYEEYCNVLINIIFRECM